jgi:hypothetical protein
MAKSGNSPKFNYIRNCLFTNLINLHRDYGPSESRVLGLLDNSAFLSWRVFLLALERRQEGSVS